PPPVASAPDELPGAPHASGDHFINDKVEAHLSADVGPRPGGPRHAHRHPVAAPGALPAAPHAAGVAGAVRAGHNEVPALPAPPSLSPVPHDVHLQAIGVNVVGLVVEAERRRARGTETE